MSEEFSFLEYLVQQQPDRLDALYESQWTCMATFRALPPLAKHYVMRLLFIESVPLGARFVSIPGGLQPEPNAQRRRDCKGPSQPTQPPCSPSRRASGVRQQRGDRPARGEHEADAEAAHPQARAVRHLKRSRQSTPPRPPARRARAPCPPVVRLPAPPPPRPPASAPAPQVRRHRRGDRPPPPGVPAEPQRLPPLLGHRHPAETSAVPAGEPRFLFSLASSAMTQLQQLHRQPSLSGSVPAFSFPDELCAGVRARAGGPGSVRADGVGGPAALPRGVDGAARAHEQQHVRRPSKPP